MSAEAQKTGSLPSEKGITRSCGMANPHTPDLPLPIRTRGLVRLGTKLAAGLGMRGVAFFILVMTGLGAVPAQAGKNPLACIVATEQVFRRSEPVEPANGSISLNQRSKESETLPFSRVHEFPELDELYRRFVQFRVMPAREDILRNYVMENFFRLRNPKLLKELTDRILISYALASRTHESILHPQGSLVSLFQDVIFGDAAWTQDGDGVGIASKALHEDGTPVDRLLFRISDRPPGKPTLTATLVTGSLTTKLHFELTKSLERFMLRLERDRRLVPPVESVAFERLYNHVSAALRASYEPTKASVEDLKELLRLVYLYRQTPNRETHQDLLDGLRDWVDEKRLYQKTPNP